MGNILRLFYKLHLKRPYRSIDRLHYLKRLKRKKHKNDEWYYSDKDAWQYAGGEVLIRTRFRDTDVMFFCDPRSHVERKIIRHGLYDPHILNYMIRVLSPGTAVIDVGANVGAYAIPLAKAYPQVEVHAFEPSPQAAVRLRRNLSINALNNVFIHEAAAGAAAETRMLYAFDVADSGLSSLIAPAGRGVSYETVPVRTARLDDMLGCLERPVNVMKIDVQGYEVQVLEGAGELIRKNRPHILLEHEDGNFEGPAAAREVKKRLREFFSAINYHVFYLTRYDPDMLFPVEWERPLFGNLIALPRDTETGRLKSGERVRR